ncbi:hypothetical protein [Streptomyces sp. PsTaAH-124]|uniref:hypothetical protein n=1 Tax=Streptomyces sp. PsTaAH-124 TaxID=1157638 RepID=UPI000370BE8E|nr:hypothetical protein [Streptomyces sp. PsTaAH-124]
MTRDLSRFERCRVAAARETLAAALDVDLLDGSAMARIIGRLETALRDLVHLVDGDGGQTAGPGPVVFRCPAAHPEDPTPCAGPVVVTVLDRTNAGVDGCEHHAVSLLASVTGTRPVPKPNTSVGLAVRIFRAADHTRPFPWREGRS